jgi:hypothetical protein
VTTSIRRRANGWLGILAGHSTSPSPASWLNAVEGFFAKLTRRRLTRGVCRDGRPADEGKLDYGARRVWRDLLADGVE